MRRFGRSWGGWGMSSENPACLELRAKAPATWGVEPLDVVTDFQEGPGILAKDFHATGIPLLRLRNIETPQVQLEGCNFLKENKVRSKWSHFALKHGDLLISTSASLGRVSVVGVEAVGAIAYTGIIRFRSRDARLHHEYLRAFLSSKSFIEQAERMATGSVIRHFGPTHLKQMAITLPPLAAQVQISEIFDLLDDRIALLRQTNTTLEAIAQALFKSWFVDFDPVRAKMAGRVPEGTDEATAALFPDGFEETELGDAPKGWQVSSLGDQCSLGWGNTTITKKSYVEHGFPAFSAAGQDGFVEVAERSGIGSVISAIGTVGVVHLATGSWTAIKNTLTAQCKTDGDSAYLHYLLKRTNFPSRGSTQQFISQSDARALRVLCPPMEVRMAFGSFAVGVISKLVANQEQVESLTELRDTLLPRLISGQLRLPEAQAMLEEAS